MIERSDERLILRVHHLDIKKRRILLRAKNVRVARAAACPQGFQPATADIPGIDCINNRKTDAAARRRIRWSRWTRDANTLIIRIVASWNIRLAT